MIKILAEGQEEVEKLSLPQKRVLQVLAKAAGPLTRGKLSDKIGNQTDVVVGRAVGYSDPAKRAVFEQTKDGGHRPSLLTLGYVRELELDIDGLCEIGIELTEEGRKVTAKFEEEDLGSLRQRR